MPLPTKFPPTFTSWIQKSRFKAQSGRWSGINVSEELAQTFPRQCLRASNACLASVPDLLSGKSFTIKSCSTCVVEHPAADGSVSQTPTMLLQHLHQLSFLL